MTARQKEKEIRKRWSADEKAAIVMASYDPRATVSGVAKKFGVSAVSLYLWRKEYSRQERPGSEEWRQPASVEPGGEPDVPDPGLPRAHRAAHTPPALVSASSSELDRRLAALEAELAELRSELSYHKRQKSLLIEFIRSISSQLKLISDAEDPFSSHRAPPKDL